MPKPYSKEFRHDVVAVARKGEAPLNQIARDFGISEGCHRRRRRHRAEHDRLVAQHIDIGDCLTTISDHHRDIAQNPTTVMDRDDRARGTAFESSPVRPVRPASSHNARLPA